MLTKSSHSVGISLVRPVTCRGMQGPDDVAANDLTVSEQEATVEREEHKLAQRLQEIIEKRQLTALFQPIIQMQTGGIIGYEGLIRGPSDSPLHSPLNLFKVARSCNLSVEVEHLCRRVTLERFAEMKLPGNLFLNVSPECLLLQPHNKQRETLGYIHEVGIDPKRVIIELTESQPTYDYDLLRAAVTHYRAMGFRIAIDDLGEGFSSLRLWSELRPEYVKIDMHFVQGINQDPIKLQFVRSIQEIAEKSGTLVIAEGIETDAELLMIRDLGVAYGQGYKIARPNAQPATELSADLHNLLRQNGVAIYPQETGRDKVLTAFKLLRSVQAVTPDVHNNRIYEMFNCDPTLEVIPVVSDDVPIGLITRTNLIDNFARPYLRELHGRKSCTLFMDANPMITDKNTALHALSQIIVDADRHHLFNGFIITDAGKYIGMGNAHDLMREITQMQISAARYANPLTLLPGNVPIDEHINRLLESGARFSTCYVDLDHFKPYNDVYGYRKGDDILRLTGKILGAHCDPQRDFVGHIGGDDFIVLFQSEDWEERCQTILKTFATVVPDFYSEEDLKQGGYISEDRRGKKVFHTLVTMSLGIVKVNPGQYGSHHQIAAIAAEAKRQAKKIPGNSIFIDRRQGPGLPEKIDEADSLQFDLIERS
ncbi:MAG TPA: GGDEF domain-containing protein [Herminiimonas sp.]|nr:GGDEF domain-containing protein [Herminiimonas sp.]